MRDHLSPDGDLAIDRFVQLSSFELVKEEATD